MTKNRLSLSCENKSTPLGHPEVRKKYQLRCNSNKYPLNTRTLASEPSEERFGVKVGRRKLVTKGRLRNLILDNRTYVVQRRSNSLFGSFRRRSFQHYRRDSRNGGCSSAPTRRQQRRADFRTQRRGSGRSSKVFEDSSTRSDEMQALTSNSSATVSVGLNSSC